MYIYNVSIKVEHHRADEWLTYMKEKHMQDVLSTGHFTESRICRLLDEGDLDGVTFAVQYTCDDLDDYLAYKRNDAASMQRDMIEKFGNDFVAFRSVMEVL